MFTMDVPSAPAQQTPIVLAQSATPTAAVPDYILKDCAITISTLNIRTLDPAGLLAIYLGNKSNIDLYSSLTADTIKITQLESTAHGKLNAKTVSGRVYYEYQSDTGYVGKDKAIFMAEFEGRRYKIIVELRVFETAPMENQGLDFCPPPKLIKVNGKPVSGSIDYNLDNITVTFADLAGGALGQTTGNSITLDTTAAGNGWFVDTTPSDNSEYLPTSNPFEWVAKAGSAAAGKMDMLSVLLHEYGHALGINHSADPNDFMGTTLTAGVRRLPTADEMALMQGLVAQAKASLLSDPFALSLSKGENSTNVPSWFDKLTTNGQGNAPAFPTIPLGTSFIGFLGLLRSSRYGGVSTMLDLPPGLP